jgi:ubiquitin C-terminal hydrolase
MVKDCLRATFPVILDMIPYAVQTKTRYRYQLAAVISHLGNPKKDQGHYMTFLRIFGQWIRFNDTEVEAIEESAAPEESFSEQRDPLKLPLSCSMWQRTEQVVQ